MKTATLAPARSQRARACEAPRYVLQGPPEALVEATASQWALYREVLHYAREAGVRTAVGGGLATAFYTGLWRPGKDIDLYVLPEARDALIEATRRAGMEDYHAQLAYDRRWIYRAVREGVIVDVIFALANGYGAVDAAWLAAGPAVELAGARFALLAPEEMLVTKLHVLQRDRCDWPDLLNVLYTNGPAMDWDRVLSHFADEERLVAALVELFAWLAPARAAGLPDWLWERLRIAPPDPSRPVPDQVRIDRLDTRPWFTPHPGP
jgi:hypothetical protein